MNGARKAMLVDAGDMRPGTPDGGQVVVDLLDRLEVPTLDYVVLTHYDSEQQWEQCIHPLTATGTKLLRVRDGEVIGDSVSLGGNVSARIVAGGGYVLGHEGKVPKATSANERSIAVLISNGDDFDFLVTGDLIGRPRSGKPSSADDARLEELLAKGPQAAGVNLEVLRTGHHGASNATAPGFVSVAPRSCDCRRRRQQLVWPPDLRRRGRSSGERCRDALSDRVGRHVLRGRRNETRGRERHDSYRRARQPLLHHAGLVSLLVRVVGVRLGGGTASGCALEAEHQQGRRYRVRAASGPAKAKAIVDYRNANGPFATVDDLVNVPGIRPATLDKIRDLVVAE